MNNRNLFAIKVMPADNVATIFGLACKNDTVQVLERNRGKVQIKLTTDVPYGHKFAVVPIKKGDYVRKYGEILGATTSDIDVGMHVHVHNLESLRGRGDWHE